MKKLLLAVAIFLTAGSALVNLNSCSSPSTTTIEHDTVYQHYWDPEQTGVTSTLIGVCFPTLKLGTAVGAGGTLVQTTDGGNTWNLGFGGVGGDLYGVSFSDQNNGIVAGNGGAVLKTTNGGITWTQLSVAAGGQFRNVLMIDANTAIVIGTDFFSTDNTQGIMYKTTNAGLTWSQITVTGAPGLYGIAFSGTMNGWVSGLDGTIFHTTDGGLTWTKQTSNVPATQMVCNLSFTDATHGMAVGLDGIAGISTAPNAGFIATTSDGGTTWTKTVTTPLDGIKMVDAKHAVAVGYGGTIMETSDGGQTWTTKSVGSLRLLNVFMNDANNGAAVGENGQVFMLGSH